MITRVFVTYISYKGYHDETGTAAVAFQSFCSVCAGAAGGCALLCSGQCNADLRPYAAHSPRTAAGFPGKGTGIKYRRRPIGRRLFVILPLDIGGCIHPPA